MIAHISTGRNVALVVLLVSLSAFVAFAAVHCATLGQGPAIGPEPTSPPGFRP